MGNPSRLPKNGLVGSLIFHPTKTHLITGIYCVQSISVYMAYFVLLIQKTFLDHFMHETHRCITDTAN